MNIEQIKHCAGGLDGEGIENFVRNIEELLDSEESEAAAYFWAACANENRQWPKIFERDYEYFITLNDGSSISLSQIIKGLKQRDAIDMLMEFYFLEIELKNY